MKTEEQPPQDPQWNALFQEVHAQEARIDLTDAILSQIEGAAEPVVPKAKVQQQLRLAWGSFALSMTGMLALVLSSSIWWPILSASFRTYLTETVSVCLVSACILGIGITLFWQLEPLMAYYADRRRLPWHLR
ncbi:MAG: hypothetical protein AAF399_14745 [Bacteroidota bacterium]